MEAVRLAVGTLGAHPGEPREALRQADPQEAKLADWPVVQRAGPPAAAEASQAEMPVGRRAARQEVKEGDSLEV